MGSTLSAPGELRFDILVRDPDVDDPQAKITKIDIVKDGGVVVEQYQPTPEHSIRWQPVIRDTGAKYFLVRVWTAGGGESQDADPSKPMAWLAPVWTGR
jgi:hypothetical protein